jgi:hypothetical protein
MWLVPNRVGYPLKGAQHPWNGLLCLCALCIMPMGQSIAHRIEPTYLNHLCVLRARKPTVVHKLHATQRAMHCVCINVHFMRIFARSCDVPLAHHSIGQVCAKHSLLSCSTALLQSCMQVTCVWTHAGCKRIHVQHRYGGKPPNGIGYACDCHLCIAICIQHSN